MESKYKKHRMKKVRKLSLEMKKGPARFDTMSAFIRGKD